jgi:hypothetical protein
MTWSHMLLPVDNGRILDTRISNSACELGSSTNLVLLAEVVLTCELGLLTSLALLAVELVLAMEKEAHFHFPLELETNTRFPLVVNVLVLSALLSAPFVLPPTHSCNANCSLVKGSIKITGIRGTLPS